MKRHCLSAPQVFTETLDQKRQSIGSSWGKSSSLPVSVIGLLLEHSHTCVFTYVDCFHSTMADLSTCQRQLWPPEPEIVTVWPLQEMCAEVCSWQTPSNHSGGQTMGPGRQLTSLVVPSVFCVWHWPRWPWTWDCLPETMLDLELLFTHSFSLPSLIFLLLYIYKAFRQN